MAQRKTYASHEGCFYLSRLAAPRNVLSNKQNSSGSATRCWRSRKILSGYVDLKKKIKKKRDGKLVRLTLRLQHKATRAATASLRDCVIRCEVTSIHDLEIQVSPRDDDDGFLCPFTLAFKNLKNQAQPADVAHLLLDCSTQTRAWLPTATYSSGKKKENICNTPGTQLKTEIKIGKTQ